MDETEADVHAGPRLRRLAKKYRFNLVSPDSKTEFIISRLQSTCLLAQDGTNRWYKIGTHTRFDFISFHNPVSCCQLCLEGTKRLDTLECRNEFCIQIKKVRTSG